MSFPLTIGTASFGRYWASIERCKTSEVNAVVVVDDSDEPVDLTKEFVSLDLKQILLDGRTFISKAKNIGWRSLTTENVYFIDDDNVIGEQTIAPVFGISQNRNPLPR